jgi:calcineurin-like phosphoesterase family protein
MIDEKISHNIWFTSDLHLGHKNLVRGSTSWEGEERLKDCRDFDSLEEHDNYIIDNINKVVGYKDILYIIGDFFLGSRDRIKYYRDQIKCQNVHLILGNHDRLKYEDYKLFSSVHDLLYKKIGGHKMMLCHYSMRTWRNSSHGSWHLFGHSHSSLNYLPHGKSLDVGLDSAKKIIGEYRPFHIKEIEQILSNREIISIDHH